MITDECINCDVASRSARTKPFRRERRFTRSTRTNAPSASATTTNPSASRSAGGLHPKNPEKVESDDQLWIKYEKAHRQQAPLNSGRSFRSHPAKTRALRVLDETAISTSGRTANRLSGDSSRRKRPATSSSPNLLRQGSFDAVELGMRSSRVSVARWMRLMLSSRRLVEFDAPAPGFPWEP